MIICTLDVAVLIQVVFLGFIQTLTQCLKITEKVSFNIASKAREKLIKNAKNYQFGEFLKSEVYD